MPSTLRTGRKSICGVAIAAGACPRASTAGPAYCAKTGDATANTASALPKFKMCSFAPLQDRKTVRYSKSDASLSGRHGQFHPAADAVAVGPFALESQRQPVVALVGGVAKNCGSLTDVGDHHIDVSVIIQVSKRRAPPGLRGAERGAGECRRNAC